MTFRLHGLLEDAPQLVPPVTNWPVIGCICWGGGVDDEAVMDLVGVAGVPEELGTLMEGDTLTMVRGGVTSVLEEPGSLTEGDTLIMVHGGVVVASALVENIN